MKLTRKLKDLYSITLEEAVEWHKMNWIFAVSDGKLITATIEKRSWWNVRKTSRNEKKCLYRVLES